MSRKGFTIFELIAVLTVISITLVIVLGSYNSWATAHALDGAVRTLEAGLLKARAIAKAQNTVVLFTYCTTDPTTNNLRQVSGYEIYACTNNAADSETLVFEDFRQVDSQRLNRYVTLMSNDDGHTAEAFGDLCFSPSGGVLSDALAASGLPVITTPREILVSTRRSFAFTDGATEGKPLCRIIRIDLATGLPSVHRTATGRNIQ